MSPRALALTLSVPLALIACGGDPAGGSDLDGPGAGAAADLAGSQAADLAASPRPDLGGTGDLSNGASFTVSWNQACWQLDAGKRYQAMEFKLVTSTPMPLEGTLYFAPNCDPVNGTDNLNDTGATMPAGNFLFWFIHFPDVKHTSAVWSFGDQKSMCVNYDGLPDC